MSCSYRELNFLRGVEEMDESIVIANKMTMKSTKFYSKITMAKKLSMLYSSSPED